MNIEVYINQDIVDANGDRVGYHPYVNVSIDSNDGRIDWNELRTLAPELEKLISTRIREAMA